MTNDQSGSTEAQDPGEAASPMQTTDPGRLFARPKTAPTPDDGAATGVQLLGLGTSRDGVVYVPTGYSSQQPHPLLVLFHGAGGNGRSQVMPFQDLADRVGLILLGPDSRRRTWDMILKDYSPDIQFLNRALSEVFRRFAVNPEQVAAGGFSDGASYALSVGLTNGDLFHRIVAFSPGFMRPAGQRDKPRVYVSHGTTDTVLPIDRCSRRIVPALRSAGYDVCYHEFDDGHKVPPEIALEAFDWLSGTAGDP